MASHSKALTQTLASQTDDIAIRASGITVAYRSYKERPASVKEWFIRCINGKGFRHYSTFDALADVSFEVPKGKVFGIVGSNGSGKSTLLKVLAGVLKPTVGTLEVNGSVASLIELGVGFDPELNAIENIYLNGSLHRKSRVYLKDRIESILEFADLHDFASTPIKYYSSGMAARLGFAVAIDIDPEILLVDEILAVGDERFQLKCQEAFKRFLESGKTIVLVSHDLNMLEQRADQVALLSRGELIYLGDPSTAIHLYRDENYKTALS